MLNRLTVMRVMIAEDSESVRFALRMLMKHLGHEVVAMATDGEEVLQQYDGVHPELILMDVRMPRMDGLTCLGRLAERDPQVRVVIITAGRTTEHEARQAGARGYIEKPFDVSVVDQVIHAAAAA
jgi:two-component system response regulator AlgR